MKCISSSGDVAAVGCVDVGVRDVDDVSSVVIIDLADVSCKVRRVIRAGGSLSCLHLDHERVVAAGHHWLGAWRVLDRENYSRQGTVHKLCQFSSGHFEPLNNHAGAP